MLFRVTFTSSCRTSESRTGCGVICRFKTKPRSLRFSYFGKTSEEENGCSMRPKKPRFRIVVVVIGAGVGVPIGEADVVPAGLGVGEASNRVSCALTAVADRT